MLEHGLRQAPAGPRSEVSLLRGTCFVSGTVPRTFTLPEEPGDIGHCHAVLTFLANFLLGFCQGLKEKTVVEKS